MLLLFASSRLTCVVTCLLLALGGTQHFSSGTTQQDSSRPQLLDGRMVTLSMHQAGYCRRPTARECVQLLPDEKPELQISESRRKRANRIIATELMRLRG